MHRSTSSRLTRMPSDKHPTLSSDLVVIRQATRTPHPNAPVRLPAGNGPPRHPESRPPLRHHATVPNSRLDGRSLQPQLASSEAPRTARTRPPPQRRPSSADNHQPVRADKKFQPIAEPHDVPNVPRPRFVSQQLAPNHGSSVPPMGKLAVEPSSDLAVHFTPDHVFVCLDDKNMLRVYNLSRHETIESLRRSVLTMGPHVVSDKIKRNVWEVEFAGEPWCLPGNEGISAKRLIAKLFSSLAAEGYSYLCTIHASNPLHAPRMLFTSSPPSRESEFFLMSFSLSRTKITIIDAPPAVTKAIAATLRHSGPITFDNENSLPIVEDDESEKAAEVSSVHVVRMRSSPVKSLFRLRRVEKSSRHALPLISQMLKVISSHGFRLEAAVPMGRAGLFGLSGRRELWVFRSVGWFRG